MPDSSQLRARVWIAQVGRVPLLLLDSDIPENEHDLRGVTDRLYGGDQEHRIKQEILAGIGGVRAIRAFTEIEGLPAPQVFHMNEGHAGFLGVERIRELMTEGLDFDTALTVVRSSTVFTTHTPVPAGIDRFPVEMVKRYFGSPAGSPSGASSRLLPGVPLDRDHRVRRRGRPVEVQHGAHGPAAGAARQRGVAAARPSEPRDVQRAVAGIRLDRGADRFDHQWRARADLGRAAVAGVGPRAARLGFAERTRGVAEVAAGRYRAHVVDPVATTRAARRRRSGPAAAILAGAGRVGC